MTNETINAIAASLSKIGKELEVISEHLMNSSEEQKTVPVTSEPEKSEPEKSEQELVPAKPEKKSKRKKKQSDQKKKLVKKTKEPTVLDRVLKVIKRSRKGATVEKIKEATNLDKKQISNSLYKLTKKGLVQTVSRGVYIPADE